MISLTNIIQTHFIGGWDSHFLGVGSPCQITWDVFFQAPSAQGNTVHVTPCISSTSPACHSGKLQVMLVDSRPGCFLGQFFNSDFTVKTRSQKRGWRKYYATNMKHLPNKKGSKDRKKWKESKIDSTNVGNKTFNTVVRIKSDLRSWTKIRLVLENGCHTQWISKTFFMALLSALILAMTPVHPFWSQVKPHPVLIWRLSM